MILSVELPDSVAQQMHLDGKEGSRRALERLALEGYRAGELSRGQVSELLNLSVWETEALLKEHGCGLGMNVDKYERDSRQLREFLGR